jgi:hypothetical protein
MVVGSHDFRLLDHEHRHSECEAECRQIDPSSERWERSRDEADQRQQEQDEVQRVHDSSLPKIGIAGSSNDDRWFKLPFIAEVDGIVSPSRHTNEVFRIENGVIEVDEILYSNRIHVVH